MSVKSAIIYKKASELISNKKQDYSCWAIERAGDDYFVDCYHMLGDYKDYFKHFADEELGWWSSPYEEKERLNRSLALLFMAEIAKDMK